MNHPSDHSNLESSSSPPTVEVTQKTTSTPLQCFTGALISGPMAIAMYFLTSSIAHTFAEKPIPSGNQLAINLAVLVRTLVVGVATLASGIFAIITLGLIALGVQLLIQNKQSSGSPTSES